MEYRKIIIANNGRAYKIVSIEKIKYQTVKRGTIERYLKGDNLDTWLNDYTDYYVTVIDKNEGIQRVFVLNEQDAEKRLFLSNLNQHEQGAKQA